MRVIFDVDDTLIPFTQAVLDKVNEYFGKSYKFTECDWGFNFLTNEEQSYAKKLFKTNSDFYMTIPCPKEAIEIVDYCIKNDIEVFFATSVYSDVMTSRANYLIKYFKDVEPSNIIMTGRKDLLNCDILFDDKVDHIKSSIAKHPIVVSRPWNNDLSGFKRVDFLDYIPMIQSLRK